MATTSTFSESEFLRKIPYSQDEAEYEMYRALIPTLHSATRRRLLVITDIEQDFDDYLAILFLSHMHTLGVVELAGFIANHSPAKDRAMLLRTVLHLQGVGDIPVAVGSDGTGGRDQRELFYYELRNSTFAKQAWNDKPFLTGKLLINSLMEQVDKGNKRLTVLSISSRQDLSEFFESYDNLEHLGNYFEMFVSQGGYLLQSDGSLKVDKSSTNNNFNLPAAENYVHRLESQKLPSDSWSKHVAVAAKLDGSNFQDLKGPLGEHFLWLWHRQEFKFYWDPFNEVPFMENLNVEWYLKTRLGLDPSSEQFKQMMSDPPTFRTVTSMVGLIVYDAAPAVGALGDDVLQALGILGRLPGYNTAFHLHRVFGASPDDLGGINALRLREVFSAFLFGSLRSSFENSSRLIPTNTIRHDVQTYDVSLKVFNLQLPHLKQLKRCEAQAAKSLGKDREHYENVSRKLRAARLFDELGHPVLDSRGVQYSSIPDRIPYELLYQLAIKEPIPTT